MNEHMITGIPTEFKTSELPAELSTQELIEAGSVPGAHPDAEYAGASTVPNRNVVRVDPNTPGVVLNARRIAERSRLIPELNPEELGPRPTPEDEVRFIGSAIKAAQRKG